MISEMVSTADKGETMRNVERPQVAVLQRLRRVSRQVWNRNRWGSVVTQHRWSLLERPGTEAAATIHQDLAGLEDES